MHKKLFLGILTITCLQNSFLKSNANQKSKLINKNHHTVIAILEAKPEFTDYLESELVKVSKYSLQEPYCINYSVNRDKENPNQFILHEVWLSAADHKRQFKKPYIIDFIKNIDGKLSKPYQIITATKLPSTDAKNLEKKLIEYFKEFLELDSNIKEVIKEKFKVNKKELIEVLLDKISPAEIAAKIFMKHFTIDETKTIVDFHTSRTGIKFGNKFSDVIDEFQDALTNKIKDFHSSLISTIVSNPK